MIQYLSYTSKTVARTLAEQTRAFHRALSDLVKKYQFRDRNETVAFGVSVSQAYALASLADQGVLTMGELAADLHLSVSATTRVVDPLVSRGLARRSPGRDDRRVTRVELTARGRPIWGRAEDELLELDAEVLRAISPSEREALIRSLRRLSEATSAWRARKAQERS